MKKKLRRLGTLLYEMEIALRTSKVCTGCHKKLPLTDFGFHKGAKDRLRGRCKLCRHFTLQNSGYIKYDVAKHQTKHAQRPWIAMIANAKTRAARKGWAFDLDQHVDEIAARVSAGVCEVSGLGFRADRARSPYSVSLDRKDSTKGYVYDNIRIICWGINRAMADWDDSEILPVLRAWLEKSNDA